MAGMKSITDLRNRVTELKNGLDSGAWLRNIIMNNEAVICDMNAKMGR